MNAKHFLTHFGDSIANWDVPTLVNMAHNHGYTFTAADLETAADELWGNLSEDQLRDIAGGGGNGNSNPGPVTVDKTNMDGKKDGGAWTPPPGDVSGNSCFFTKR